MTDDKANDAAILTYLAYDADKEEKLLDNPKFIKTPIVRNGKKATVGYCPEVCRPGTENLLFSPLSSYKNSVTNAGVYATDFYFVRLFFSCTGDLLVRPSAGIRIKFTVLVFHMSDDHIVQDERE